MDNWKVIAPIGIALVGTAATLVYLIKNKDKLEDNTQTPSPKAKKAEIKNVGTGTYSFVAGYKDAKTVEVDVKYNQDKLSFAVVEDGFLTYSSDSHVAVMYGEDFNLQLEYADFYSGDDFAKLKDILAEKYKGFEEVDLPAFKAYKYFDGDSVCYCLPAGASYVLINVMPSKDSKETSQTLPSNSDLQFILNNISIK